MNTKSARVLALVCVLAVSFSAPMENWAASADTGSRAGEVSRVIPAVSIERGAKNISASAKTIVDWQDLINTQATARARIALDDGSVLNVGSSSSIRVVKHDPSAQQTDLEIGFGKLRSQAQKISQPNGKFEVRTPAGVAGVVGTDFYVGYENDVMTVIVFDGIVRVCNPAGVCVVVKPGQISTLRNNDSAGPTVAQATLVTLTDAVDSTRLESPSVEPVHHIGKGTAITLGVLATIPLIVVPIVATRGSSPNPAPTTPGNVCSPNNPKAC